MRAAYGEAAPGRVEARRSRYRGPEAVQEASPPGRHVYGVTYTMWRAKYAGLGIGDVMKFRQLEEHSRPVKQRVTERALDIEALESIIARN